MTRAAEPVHSKTIEQFNVMPRDDTEQPRHPSCLCIQSSLGTHLVQGAQWLSGRVLDLRQRGRMFEPHWPSLSCVLEQEH